MNHAEALSKRDKALEKLYEPLYARKRDRKPVPPLVMDHYNQTAAALLTLLKTDRDEHARRYYSQRKSEIDKMFEDIDIE
jgi:hypothetical protein